MAEPFSPDETADVTGTVDRESVYTDVVEDNGAADADADADADASDEDTEPAQGMAGLA